MFLRVPTGKREEEKGRTSEKQMVASPLLIQLIVKFRYLVCDSKLLGTCTLQLPDRTGWLLRRPFCTKYKRFAFAPFSKILQYVLEIR